MAEISGIGERKILEISINEKILYGFVVETIHLPTAEKSFWEFDMKDSTVILATGNVVVKHDAK
jgi:hypothetical protein